MNKKMKTVKASDLKTAPWNPRKQFDEKLVGDIAEDLKDGKPLIQAPSVWSEDGKTYYIIAGNTRMEAVRKAGLETVDVVVWDCTREEAMAMTFKENEQRADVYPIQQALLIGNIFEDGRSVDEIVRSTGLRKSSVYDYLSIARRVHPEIIRMAVDHPANFTKGTLIELTGFPVDVQETVVDEWRSECGGEGEEPEDGDEWRPNTWSLRSRIHDLKGCRFAGPGSRCATCPKNTANIGTLPGFEDDEAADSTCMDSDCYRQTLDEWRKSVVEKKTSKYPERYELRNVWDWEYEGATEKKPTAEKPCCYYWWDGDKLKVKFGPSRKAKIAAEKAAKAAAKAEAAREKEDKRICGSIIGKLCGALGISGGYEEESVVGRAKFLVLFFKLASNYENPESLRLVRKLADDIRWTFTSYGGDRGVVAETAGIFRKDLDLTPEELEWIEGNGN